MLSPSVVAYFTARRLLTTISAAMMRVYHLLYRDIRGDVTTHMQQKSRVASIITMPYYSRRADDILVNMTRSSVTACLANKIQVH